MIVTYPTWPTWNPQFPGKDVKRIVGVKYFDGNEQKELPTDQYRLAIGRNGISSLILLNKNSLPQTEKRNDAVAVEYDP